MTELADRVLLGQRAAVARAITLVESTRPGHRADAIDLLDELIPHSGRAMRVGISGVPGVGKSTFIDELGTMLTGQGHRVAVLAVDPSSTTSLGSILGDKTRMARLANDERAFIRPSPSAGTLGGVTRATREAMVVLEAAGHDVVLVETVGVGQSETAVSEMVDTFLFLTLARTGDQLQGIKRGILELADVIAVNKADGRHTAEAGQAARELGGAIRMLSGPSRTVPVLTCSATEGTGIADVWRAVRSHASGLADSGERDRVRSRQQVQWMWSAVEDQILRDVRSDADVVALLPNLEAAVAAGGVIPSSASRHIIRAYRSGRA